MTSLPMVSTAVSWAIKMGAVVAWLVEFLCIGGRRRVVTSWEATPHQVSTFWICQVQTDASILWCWWCRSRCNAAHHQWSNLVRLFILIILWMMLHQLLLSVALTMSSRVRWLFYSQLRWWLLGLCGRCYYSCYCCCCYWWLERWECRQSAIIRLIS